MIGNIDLVDNNSITYNDIKLFFDYNDYKIYCHNNCNNEEIWKSNLKDIFSSLSLIYYLNDEIIIFLDEDSKYLINMKLSNGEITSIIELNRDDNEDSKYFHSKFYLINNGIILIYEEGIIKFDLKGRIGWKHNHKYFDWHFVGIRQDKIYYESEFDGKWCYEVKTGIKIRI